MTTIKEVARRSGVSTATVSHVINNGPRPVTAKTRQRVLAVIDEMNYRPSAIARGLNNKRVNTIGVVLLISIASPLHDPYYRDILAGIIDELTAHRQSLNLFNGNVWANAQDTVPLFCDGRCDGLLVFLPFTGDHVIEALKKQATPFAIIGEGSCDEHVSSIDIDNIAAAREMTKYLISQGHTRIAHLEGDLDLQSASDRLDGYRMALDESGIPMDPSLVLPGRYEAQSGYSRVQELFRRQGDPPTAIFAANDVIAYAAIQALQDLGLSVPEDVSVVGIDGIEPPAGAAVQLTTIDQHLRMLGTNAAQVILARLSLAEGGPRKQTQPFHLKIGNSVRKIDEAWTE